MSQNDEMSIIIELLSFEADLPDDGIDGQSARHFFDDLADANSAQESVCDFCGDVSGRRATRGAECARALTLTRPRDASAWSRITHGWRDESVAQTMFPSRRWLYRSLPSRVSL